MILMLKAPNTDVFKMSFLILLKHFHDSLNIVVILALSFGFFSAKYAQFPISFNIYGVKLNEWHLTILTVIIHFWDKPYKEINFKSHSKSVLLCKQQKLLSHLHMSRLILVNSACLCSLLHPILWPVKEDARFEYVPWKNVCFCFISIAWVHFIHKTKKFWFWKSLKCFNIFW